MRENLLQGHKKASDRSSSLPLVYGCKTFLLLSVLLSESPPHFLPGKALSAGQVVRAFLIIILNLSFTEILLMFFNITREVKQYRNKMYT